ncbi:MAG: hypothetical protein RL264_3086 [Bacteroidota bacterium]|jgi:dTDP-4-dehydrorhamnose 3,5-epimerase
MEIKKTKIEGVIEIYPRVFGDERGFFYEPFHEKRYKDAIGDFTFVQDNLSKSSKNVLRGLHFQKPPHAQGKLVSVITGSVFDVAVDIRKESPTFGEWVGVVLSGEKKNQLWIPPGFAHGFVSLEDNTIFSYKCTNLYHPESEGCLKWNDPNLQIDWNAVNPIISPKDELGESFVNFVTPF